MIKINIKNKKTIIITVALVFSIISIYFIIYTLSKYKANASSTPKVQTAFYILNQDYQSMNIDLGSMIPKNNPYVYTFSISNTDGTHRAEINIQYDLKIRTTTNLPLTYELYLNQNYTDPNSINIITDNEVMQDSDQTYFRQINTATQKLNYTLDQTNIYTLVIYFDSKYSDINYQNIPESIELSIDAKQVI